MTSALAFLAILADLATAATLPPGVATLTAGQPAETFAVAGDMTAVTLPSATDPARSTMRYARGSAAPKDVLLGGRALGLALAAEGATAYAVVREVDRKGRVREVDLVPVDLESGRAAPGVRLPDTARGITLARDGASAFVVSHDEVRTFRLPDLTSGRLYRVPGENVAVRPLDDGRHALIVQSAAVGLVDLAAPQTREGLALERIGDAPAGLRAVMLSTTDDAPIALTQDGGAWRIEVPPPPIAAAPETVAETAPSPSPAAAPEPTVEIRTQVEPPPVIELPAAAEAPPVAAGAATQAAIPPDPSPSEAAPSAVAEEKTETAAPAPPPVAPVEEPKAAPAPPPEAGTLTGSVDGPARGSVTAIVVLGPDNILKEATRTALDASGRFTVRGLAPGSYRVVAAGAGGRVLICDPPYVTVRVGPSGGVEAPTLHALRAP